MKMTFYPFYSLNSSIEVVELVKISQRYTLILRIPSYGYEEKTASYCICLLVS
jgi:hypothetical protein